MESDELLKLKTVWILHIKPYFIILDFVASMIRWKMHEID